MQNNPHTTLVTPSAPIAAETHGGRAKCLQRLARLELPVPPTVALSFTSVHRIASGDLPDIEAILAQFPVTATLCVRPSSEDPDWGGPGAVLNIGMNQMRYETLRERIGPEAATSVYTRFVQSYSVHVARLDPNIFDDIEGEGEDALAASLRAYEEEAEESFPAERAVQLSAVLKSMARAWEGTSARLLRQAKGAPVDAGLGLVVQQMALGLGHGISGSGVLQLVNSDTGMPQITGRYRGQSQGRDALVGNGNSLYLTKDRRGDSLEELAPDLFETLKSHAAHMRDRLREEMQVEFTIEDGKLHILDGVRVARSSQAALRIAVDLANDGVISREEALMRVEPRALTEMLHPQVASDAKRDKIGR
ncbi:MAG: pyruvate, phosphate dikinase, partial [Paracoccaceae bacterium]